jgi:hypothetical protein
MEPEDESKIKSKKIATDVCKALGIWDTVEKEVVVTDFATPEC